MPTSIVKPVKFGAGEPTTFGVKSDVVAPYRYQWKRNGRLVGGSQWVSYQTPPLTTEDMTAEWSVVVHGQDVTEESDPVVLQVKQAPKPVPPPPTTPPTPTPVPPTTEGA